MFGELQRAAGRQRSTCTCARVSVQRDAGEHAERGQPQCAVRTVGGDARSGRRDDRQEQSASFTGVKCVVSINILTCPRLHVRSRLFVTLWVPLVWPGSPVRFASQDSLFLKKKKKGPTLTESQTLTAEMPRPRSRSTGVVQCRIIDKSMGHAMSNTG